MSVFSAVGKVVGKCLIIGELIIIIHIFVIHLILEIDSLHNIYKALYPFDQ